MIIFMIAVVVSYMTSNLLFVVFGILWLLFQYLDKKINSSSNLTENFITGIKKL